MTLGQRRALAVIGGLIATVALGLVAVAARSDGDFVSEILSTNERPAARSETTLPLIPVTSGAPLPTTTAVPATVPVPSADQIAAARPPTADGGPSPALSADSAVLARPDSDATRQVDKTKGCHSANDPGWQIVECGALKRDDAVLLWVVEGRGEGLRALVLREQTAGHWVTVLRAADDDGTRWSKIGVRGGDVSGDGRPDLVFGFHGRPSAPNATAVLGVDVVEGPGAVTLHRALPRGSARVESGALHTWEALGDGSYKHTTIKVIGGAWRVAATERMARDVVPPSMV